MFKSKWQKRYEYVMEYVEHELDLFTDMGKGTTNPHDMNVNNARIMVLKRMQEAMEAIKDGYWG